MLGILPNESIYSYLIRYCLKDGYPNLTSAVKYYIGSVSKQWSAQFPSFISQVSAFSGIPFQRLLFEHSVYPAYRTFLSKEVTNKVEELLQTGGTLNLESKMSLVANRLQAPSKLKYCPLCVLEDLENYAWEYWHIEHQLPGSLACSKHSCKLIGVKVNRKRLILPPTENLIRSSATDLAIKLSTLSESLFELNGFRLTSEVLNNVYRYRLVELGLATHNRSFRIKVAKWRERLKQYWEPISNDPQISEILNKDKGWQYPVNLLYGRDKAFHPLKHLLVIGHLFETFDEFISQYRLVECGHEPISVTEEKIHDFNGNDKPDDKIIELLRAGHSLRKISSACEVSIGYAKKIAQLNGVAINRRTQFIHESERRDVWRKLFIGQTTENIADTMGISIGAVEQILSCYPELVQLRKKIRYFNKRKKHRQSLIKSNHKYTTRKEIRADCSASYIWLYKHDKGWLYSNLPEAIPRQHRYSRKEK
ncbi:TnsD family Tn7-like transposition protein [Litorilituus lipolyticus]|uniref:Uncharacterized protein n=1 Tax=Litorilituus lipolyticus TaxID=2491017 RepID=A0A502L2Y9_9GAMM|nr:TnsD family Tn7-like transposition protein [Litorilituus lipolyticus]TPH18086.1 hypothetical protein EPA86_02935 [Litorilituus lipolyticus]